jgi:hypothetical protein
MWKIDLGEGTVCFTSHNPQACIHMQSTLVKKANPANCSCLQLSACPVAIACTGHGHAMTVKVIA